MTIFTFFYILDKKRNGIVKTSDFSFWNVLNTFSEFSLDVCMVFCLWHIFSGQASAKIHERNCENLNFVAS